MLGVNLWKKQVEVLEALVPGNDPHRKSHQVQVACRSGHGVGKSFVAANAVLWFLYCHSPSLVLSTAPSARQVERILWEEIHRLHGASRTALPGRLLNTRLIAGPYQQAFGFTAQNPESGAGLHAPNVLIIVDEASGVEDRLFQVLQGALTSKNCSFLLIGNPTKAHGYFFECFRTELWSRFTISCLDSPNFHVPAEAPLPYPGLVTPGWAADRAQEWGEDSDAYRVRVLGLPPRLSSDTLIPLEWLDAAEAHEPFPESPNEAVVFGLDVARYGDCETVLTIRRGMTLEVVEGWQGFDLMQSVGRVVNAARKWRPARIIADAVGMGAGVVDRLGELVNAASPENREESLKDTLVIGFESGQRATQRYDFGNQRDEAWWSLREKYRAGLIRHADRWLKLTGQLTELKYAFNSSGHVAIETKEQLRRRDKPSPDYADSVMLCFLETFTGALPGGTGHRRGEAKIIEPQRLPKIDLTHPDERLF